jgi:pantetheine-phosphate adenylyltransferase
MTKAYNTVVIGGTFDIIHTGHEELFHVADALSDKLIIGLSVAKLLLHKKYADKLNFYDVRKKNIEKYFRSHLQDIELTIVPIEVRYGNLLEPEVDVDAIIISSEPAVIENTLEINKMRVLLGLEELTIIIVPLVKDDKGERLSSTRLRKG